MFYVYILFSENKNKFYVGQTNNLEDRIRRHNAGHEISTKNGVPWKIIIHFVLESRAEAIALESKIKKRGAKRYLIDNKLPEQ
ncbi:MULTISPECIES: GIY-YIG nuclease family protein [Flavobacterium]|uniref:GIY-YIG domain-containing protein n=1 Tax=Flavobacterium hankyongi TaxID=1176532 RepID=A0ABP9AAB8_9FLAO|nr:GIY-YIG nuclease family protein [Flavobacterium sp. N1846]